jgi:aspartate kinase
MKVIKFGGTSLGSPQRMKEVANLIANENAIVVLSAISGTTNSLTEITNFLYQNKRNKAKELAFGLKEKYTSFINELFSNEDLKLKAQETIGLHFAKINNLDLHI